MRINSFTLVQFPPAIDRGKNLQLWSWREILDWKSQILDLLLRFLLSVRERGKNRVSGGRGRSLCCLRIKTQRRMARAYTLRWAWVSFWRNWYFPICTLKYTKRSCQITTMYLWRGHQRAHFGWQWDSWKHLNFWEVNPTFVISLKNAQIHENLSKLRNIIIVQANASNNFSTLEWIFLAWWS